jgi:hypothetical protein
MMTQGLSLGTLIMAIACCNILTAIRDWLFRTENLAIFINRHLRLS